MKADLFTIKQQAQEFILRLFVEPDSRTTLSTNYYTCARCGTHARLHPY